MTGWIKLHRMMVNWEWYHDSETVHLFIHLILRANHEPGRWKGIDVQRGQLITGRETLAAETGISERAIRTRLQRLKKSGEIDQQTTNRFSIITILNYDEYQGLDGCQKASADQQPTSNRPAIDQQSTTNKNDKKDKNEKNTAAAKKKTGVAAVREIRPDWWTAEEWGELIEHRRSVKATQSVRAYNALIREFNIARVSGETPQTILDDMTSGKGWAGYKWEWVCNRRRTNKNNDPAVANSNLQPKSIAEAAAVGKGQRAASLLRKLGR